ncbi:RNA-binding, RBD [Venustampulla echinocandica]|uniref:RNA-binding, RBD n=1 Tax=Venustampulla echinocandica TaxID=2656787 RepID=A0A370TS22_9HELO|nr:RNA-binding, RBD [Venustampulla echinocandica]RDL38321.1 RNA-binding, RBD [Venustampulla echinocandica]
MSGSQWPDPELSIGESCGSVDALGRFKCWAIKEESPAHHAWEAISRPVVQLLQEELERLDPRETDLMVEMFMIGDEAERASPTLLFSCYNKPVRQRAMALVIELGILDSHPQVLMAECSWQRRPLSMEETSEVTALPPGVYATEPLRHCGVSVLISGEHPGSPRKATLGGIVFIAGLFYGIITLYACKQISSTASRSDADPQFAFYGLEKLDDSSDVKHDSGASLSLDGVRPDSLASAVDSRNEPFEPSLHAWASKRIPRLSSAQNRGETPDSERTASPTPERSLEEQLKFLATLEDSDDNISPELGNIFVSAPERSLDWALVEIENSELMLENISLNNRRFMTNSIYWRNQSFHTEAIHPKGVAQCPADADVLISTGNRDTALEGRLSATPSFQKAPWSITFQELWVVRCTNGNFFDGDCGSWVVDYETGDLYGIIALGLPGTETAYIIPASHIFHSMQSHLSKQVQLSTPELWASRARLASKNKSVAPMAPVGLLAPVVSMLRRSDSSKTEKGTERNSVRISVGDDMSFRRRRSWSENSIQSTVFDTRSLHSNFTTENIQKLLPSLAYSERLSVSSTNDRLHAAGLPTRANTTGSLASGSWTPSHQIYRPYSTASTLQSIDSGYGNPPCNNLYVRNLPLEPSEDDLREYFSEMPGYEGLRMKRNEQECFVRFSDVDSAMDALQKSDDHRFSSDDRWGIMVGYARNGVRPAHLLPSQEDIELEVSIAELLGAETLPSARKAGGRISKLMLPARRAVPPMKQVTDKSRLLQEMFAETRLANRDSDKVFVPDSDNDDT